MRAHSNVFCMIKGKLVINHYVLTCLNFRTPKVPHKLPPKSVLVCCIIINKKERQTSKMKPIQETGSPGTFR